MEINNNKSIVKRLQACSTCADTVTGVPTGPGVAFSQPDAPYSQEPSG